MEVLSAVIRISVGGERTVMPVSSERASGLVMLTCTVYWLWGYVTGKSAAGIVHSVIFSVLAAGFSTVYVSMGVPVASVPANKLTVKVTSASG